MTSEAVSIESRNLNIGRRILIEDLQIGIPEGQVHVISGPNGVGKSLLFDVVTGLRRHKGTSIELNGHGLSRAGSYQRWRAGLRRLFQSPVLPGNLTGEDLVCVADSGSSQVSQVASDLQDIFGDLRRELKTLSYGRRRHAELILALAGDAAAILLDEPLAGADENVADAMMDRIAGARDAGAAILAVDHTDRIEQELATRCYRWPVPEQPMASPCLPSPVSARSFAPFHLDASIRDFGFSALAPRIQDGLISIRGGEALALTGPNGSGKSSLLRALIAAEPHTWTGSVDVRHSDTCRILLAPQPPKLVPDLGTLENLELMTIGYLKERRSKVRERLSLSLANIGFRGHAMRTNAANLSGGEAAMASLVGALSSDASLVLLDEPTDAMSEAWTEVAISMLRRAMKDEGRSFIIATHDPRLLAHFPHGSRVDLTHDYGQTAKWQGYSLSPLGGGR